MRFGWYGFQLEHPEDWAPAALTGNREEGYARLASTGVVSGQIRWKSTKSPAELSGILKSYFERLSRDAKRQRVPLSTSSEELEGRIDYRWSAQGRGSGSLIYSPEDSRAFFIEASATNNRSVQGLHRQLLADFRPAVDDSRELWAVFGLEVFLPTGMQISKQTFQSGRTRLELRHRKATVVAERWGFGEQILARHTFQEWATAAMDISKAKIEESPEGLLMEKRDGLGRVFGLARHQLDRNQIVTVRVKSRSEEWRPKWDWLT